MKALDHWLFAPGPAARLACLRVGLCLLLAFRLATGPFLALAAQPSALFRPVSCMRLLPGMPPPVLVLLLQFIGVAAALLGSLGWRVRVTLPLAWGCGFLLLGMTSSLGKVAHNDVLLLLCLVPLLPAATADAWAVGRKEFPNSAAPFGSAYGWPVRTALVLVAGAYFFAGLGKLLNSGPAWVTSENLRWILYISSDAQPVPNSLALFVADRPWLAHLFAGATLLFELGFPVVLWRPRWAGWFAAGVVALHGGIWLAMGLNYSVQTLTALTVLIDWPAVGERLGAKAGAGGSVPASAPGIPVPDPPARQPAP